VFHPCRWSKKLQSWVEAPHFHILGYGWMGDAGEEYRQSGWIVKNLKKRKSIRASIIYLLSHAGLWREDPRAVHSLSYFGDLAYNVLVRKRVAQMHCVVESQDAVPYVIYPRGSDLAFSDLGELILKKKELINEYDGSYWEVWVEQYAWRWKRGKNKKRGWITPWVMKDKESYQGKLKDFAERGIPWYTPRVFITGECKKVRIRAPWIRKYR